MCLACSERGIVQKLLWHRDFFICLLGQKKKACMDQGIWAVLEVTNGNVVAKKKY